ncbi:hypothetical protein [Streptomyces violascens]|uniref:Uncharacterized protein n=1 Tax=Streptomyces violascens TaxID=67381 RepID=A0ABQ3QL60_9ACTN|nr:hypothetical protein [Streptomyces violascens]GGU44565.1 hypothetical protein GCM10010289_76440 [Streptomyces violascens]GHI38015.1 hypothetical protein Sviol_24230 [Streptomyces violascens]
MRLIIETEDEDGEFATGLLDLARQRQATVTVGDAVWTPERVEHLIREVAPRGRQLLRAVAEGDGWVDGEQYRAAYGDAALRGPSAAITKAVTRGIRDGWLPVGAELPFTSTYDGRSSWQKTGGYRLPRHLAAVFREAFARVFPTSSHPPQAAIDHLSELYEQVGRSPELARERAGAFFEQHAEALTAWAKARSAQSSLPEEAAPAPLRLDACADEAAAQAMANTLLSHVDASDYWRETARTLLTGYLMAAALDHGGLDTVRHWAAHPDENTGVVQLLRTGCPPESLLPDEVEQILAADPATRNGVLATVATALQHATEH